MDRVLVWERDRSILTHFFKYLVGFFVLFYLNMCLPSFDSNPSFEEFSGGIPELSVSYCAMCYKKVMFLHFGVSHLKILS